MKIFFKKYKLVTQCRLSTKRQREKSVGGTFEFEFRKKKKKNLFSERIGHASAEIKVNNQRNLSGRRRLAAEPAQQSGAQVSLLYHTPVCLSFSLFLSSGIYCGCWQHPHEFVKMFPFRIHRATQNRGGGEKKLTLNNFDDGS